MVQFSYLLVNFNLYFLLHSWLWKYYGVSYHSWFQLFAWNRGKHEGSNLVVWKLVARVNWKSLLSFRLLYWRDYNHLAYFILVFHIISINTPWPQHQLSFNAQVFHIFYGHANLQFFFCTMDNLLELVLRNLTLCKHNRSHQHIYMHYPWRAHLCTQYSMCQILEYQNLHKVSKYIPF